MNKTQILVLAFIAISAISLFNLQSNTEPKENLMFKIWKEKMNKNYDQTENQYRYQIWMKNWQYVTAHNKRYDAGLQTYEVQMNLFADLSTEQFKAKYLGLNLNSQYKATKNCTGKQAPTDNLPAQVNWQPKGAVTPVKNQGQCGSCWAFSTTGSLQGSHFKATSKLLSFSEQQLVDCSSSYGNHGCGGGLMNNSFFYVRDNGIALEQKYPYRGVGSSCKYTDQDKAWTISDCTQVTADKQLPLRAAVAQQPVSIAIEANHISFQLYKGGVYSGLCGTNLDHGVLAVGYGTQDNKLYWRVKNSWGSSWGVKGYILIERDQKDGKGKCGIQMAASYPIA